MQSGQGPSKKHCGGGASPEGIRCSACGVPFPADGNDIIELEPCRCLMCPSCLLDAHAERGASLLSCGSCDNSSGVFVTSHRAYKCLSSYSRRDASKVVQYAGVKREEEGLHLFEDEDHALPDLFALYSSVLSEKMLAYASCSDLCKLDALNKQFREFTVGEWSKRTMERFGMTSGKEGWRLGTSFLREPVYIHINLAPEHEGTMLYCGSPVVATNGSIIAVDTDDGDPDAAPYGICVYDARNLSYTGVVGDGEGGDWDVTICGPKSDEIFVTTYKNQLTIQQGDLRRTQHLPQKYCRTGNPIPSIGSETHYIAVIGNALHLYNVTGDSDLLTPSRTAVLGRDLAHDEEYFDSSISWGEDAHFVVCHSVNIWHDGVPLSSNISVWRIDTDSHCVSRTQTIKVSLRLKAVAMADDFVVGSTRDKKIHIWNRHTGEKIWSGLCDVDEDDQLDGGGIYPLSLSCHGHMLVTTSHLGCAICVWDMKIGQLLKRYNHANEERRVNMLPTGDDVTSMAYIEQLNGFFCVAGYINTWIFPTNTGQRTTALAIRSREEELRRQRAERTVAFGVAFVNMNVLT